MGKGRAHSRKGLWGEAGGNTKGRAEGCSDSPARSQSQTDSRPQDHVRCKAEGGAKEGRSGRKRAKNKLHAWRCDNWRCRTRRLAGTAAPQGCCKQGDESEPGNKGDAKGTSEKED